MLLTVFCFAGYVLLCFNFAMFRCLIVSGLVDCDYFWWFVVLLGVCDLFIVVFVVTGCCLYCILG